jgi:hypothetical protein
MKSTLAKFFMPLALSLVLLIPATSQATPITGQLAINGDAQVGATFLNFLCDQVATGSMPCPAGTGNFIASGPLAQTGSFVPYANDSGFIKNLNQGVQPLNTLFLLSNFLTFSPTGTVLSPDIALDLTFIALGTDTSAQCSAPANPSQVPAQVCTPMIASLVTAANPLGLSAFNLANTTTGSTASFTVAGNARRISTGELTPFNGNFSAVFTSNTGTTDGSYQALLAQFATGGTVTAPYSATFKANLIPTPEPGTTALMLGGLLLLAGGVRLRRLASHQ